MTVCAVCLEVVMNAWKQCDVKMCRSDTRM